MDEKMFWFKMIHEKIKNIGEAPGKVHVPCDFEF